MKLFAACLLALAASPVVAQDQTWTTWQQEDLYDLVFGAYQLDTTSRYEFSYFCSYEWGDSGLTIMSAEKWEETTSYAPEVPTRFVIDGTPFQEMTFKFENNNGNVAIAFYDVEMAEATAALVSAIVNATSEIEVSYFDKSMSFSPKGASDAIEFARRNCEL